MISKELLDEVLEIEIVDYIIHENQVKINQLWHEDNPLNRELGLFNTSYGCRVSINIYELAFRTRDYFKTKNKHLSLNQSIEDIFKEANSIYESLSL